MSTLSEVSAAIATSAAEALCQEAARILQREQDEGETSPRNTAPSWDHRDWTCECYPEFEFEMSTGVPTIPIPPIPDACCCFGLPQPFLKPGPNAFYLGMGYKAPGMRGRSEYLSTPGFIPRQPGRAEYTVERAGRGLLPPCKEGDMKQSCEVAEVFCLTGADGFNVEVTEYGARIMSIRAPDVDGVVKDVLLGFDCPEAYHAYSSLHWGGVTGRLGDRIHGPRPFLRVEGRGWLLFPQNDEDDHFMGGDLGLDKVVWEGHVEEKSVLFTHLNRAGHEDYPGDLLVTVRYSVLPVNRLQIHIEAMCTTPSPLAIIQPLVFNLAGYNAGEVAMKEQVLTVLSDKYYVSNESKVYTGAKKHVASTPFDLRIPRYLRKILRHAPNKSYDVLMCMREQGPGEPRPKDKQRLMAKLFDPHSRRVMEVWSDLPVLRLATDLGLQKRPRLPPDPVLLLEARKIIEEIIAKIIPCDDILPPRKIKPVRKYEVKEKTEDETPPVDDTTETPPVDVKEEMKMAIEDVLKDITEMRPPPNPGDIVTIPTMDRAESIQIATEILEEILSNVKARPPVFLGFNSYRYFDDCGIMIYPQLPPLLISKSNVAELVLRPGQRYRHAVTYAFAVSPRPTPHKRRRFGRKKPFRKTSSLMIDHCSAASSKLQLPVDSFLALHDTCSERFRPSETSL